MVYYQVQIYGVNKIDNISIYAIVVLDDRSPNESISLRTLLNTISRVKHESSSSLKIHVLAYDNRPVQPNEYSVESVEYYAAGTNLSLAEAYNSACLRAREQGFEWLLILDQDSHLPEDFLITAIAHLQNIHEQPQVAALVPQILHQSSVLSPYQLTLRGAGTKRFPLESRGIRDGVYALNLGAFLRLSALKQVNDYDPRFPFDASDKVLFHRLATYGKRVLIADDLRIEHDLDTKVNKWGLSAERYQSTIDAESAFCDLYLGKFAAFSCNVRLIAKLLFYARLGNQPLCAITWQATFLRLFRSRRFRLQCWQSKYSAVPSRSGRPKISQPKISVCMATYNGESYVEEQIRSILPQLGVEDELIIIDDHSKDQTINRILSLKSPQICLIRHTQNAGAVASFAEAIRNATGDIIFLSDMDDIWSPDKVRKVKDIFDTQPEITIVATATTLIDERGFSLEGPSVSLQQSRFNPTLIANLIQNRFQGSTMAFRAKLLPIILPIPAKKLFFHDAWIGLQNAAHGGKVAFLAEPLLYYRRHGNNLSRKHSRINQIRVRFQLCWALIKSLLLKKVPPAILKNI